MQSRARHKNSRIMRYWFKEYQVKFVYLLNSSRHQDSNPLTPGSTSPFSRIPYSFGFGSCTATWKINTSSCFAFCAKLCRVICPPAAMTQLHFLVLFFFPCGSWYHLASTDFPQPLPHPALWGQPSQTCVSTSQLCGSWNKTMFLFVFTSLG